MEASRILLFEDSINNHLFTAAYAWNTTENENKMVVF